MTGCHTATNAVIAQPLCECMPATACADPGVPADLTESASRMLLGWDYVAAATADQEAQLTTLRLPL
jgi:hypothetical protein